jgi:hypothetical protein
MPNWEYFLCNSSDMSVIWPMSSARAKRLQLIYNRPGSFSCQVPIDSRVAMLAKKHATCVLAVREGVPRWSGPIFTVADAVPEDTTTITAMGWLEELNRRFLQAADEPSAAFKDVIGGSIARSLIQLANTHTDETLAVRPTRFTNFVVNDVQTRTRTYKRGQNIGAAIKELIDIENGFDLTVDPISRTLTTYQPTNWAYKPDALLGYGVFPNNIASMSRTEDGTRTANAINVQSPSGAVITTAPALPIDAATTMLEDWLTVSDVNDPGVLGAYAVAEHLYRAYGVTEYVVAPKSERGLRALRLYDDFELGDAVYLSADRGRLQIKGQPVRVFGATIGDDGSGDEIISELVLSPQ